LRDEEGVCLARSVEALPGVEGNNAVGKAQTGVRPGDDIAVVPGERKDIREHP